MKLPLPANGSGFDRAVLTDANGRTRELSAPEYAALPLSERIEAVLGRRVRFYKSGQEVSSHSALRGL